MRLVAGVLLLAPLIYAGFWKSEIGPSLGTLLDPAHGLWVSSHNSDASGEWNAQLAGLGADVVVTYDDRGVPHIQATNQLDLYRALGYVVARDRLFQLEIQTRAASGTLTDLVGAAALESDREARQFGMPRAAQMALQRMDTASQPYRVLRAFGEGINSWIDALAPRNYPVEFKLLGARPVRWEPINALHLLNRMTRTLAYTTEELTNLRARATVGRDAADALFPMSAPIQEPSVPVARNAPRYRTQPFPPPGIPDSAAVVIAALTPAPLQSVLLAASVPRENVMPGSNAWAVAPSRAVNGRALLAGDMHLDLTLPSIWYEVHLTVPDTLDVYGVTIPGAPGIVVGFNRSVAWTLTSAGADVVDFYREQVDDQSAPKRYMLDSVWRDLQVVVEEYKNPHGGILRVDTVRYTHRGPMSKVGEHWISMRFTIEAAGHEIGAFISGQSATSAADWLQRMQTFGVPALGVIASDTAGNIAYRFNGLVPIRPDSGRGDLLRDGSQSRSDWLGFWKASEAPQSMNPQQGYLATTNQQPTDYFADSRYFGADWPAPWRALRINDLLRDDRKFTTDDMRRFQTNPNSARAAIFVPAFVEAGERSVAVQGASVAAARLKEWNLEYTIDNTQAILFEYAMNELNLLLWDELDVANGEQGPRPASVVAAMLLREPSSQWWDVRSTPDKESRDDLLARALVNAHSKLIAEHGEPGAGGWRWDRVRPANVYHLLRIEAFSARQIPVQGGPHTLSPFPAEGDNGASWRMVVELAPTIRAWGIYPGGQSGNPFSASYRDRLQRWADGELDELRFPIDARTLGANITATLTLRPGR